MGNEIPPDWPDIDDAKWYKVTVNKYFAPPPAGTCADPFVGRESCCERGDDIKAWIANGWECHAFHPLCGLVPALHLIGVAGPYDTFAECLLTT